MHFFEVFNVLSRHESIMDFTWFVGLVAWYSGRTSVFDRRTFLVLRSTYS